MQQWVLVSEIARNFLLGFAALGGLILAAWKLVPERKQAGTAAAQAELAR